MEKRIEIEFPKYLMKSVKYWFGLYEPICPQSLQKLRETIEAHGINSYEIEKAEKKIIVTVFYEPPLLISDGEQEMNIMHNLLLKLETCLEEAGITKDRDNFTYCANYEDDAEPFWQDFPFIEWFYKNKALAMLLCEKEDWNKFKIEVNKKYYQLIEKLYMQ
ncbi:MAG: hypothetical protein LLG02_09485 [Pelosinus sp.]|nr:hypothetical protein [Pelosinus sp.]